MKDVVDALIFNHEIKIGRVSSQSVFGSPDSDKNFIHSTEEKQENMSFWEKLKAPEKPINLIKLLNVIQESRIKDIEAKMEEDDPFIAKASVKKTEPVIESYNFVNDFVKLENNIVKRR